MIGDVVGKPGRQTLAALLPVLRRRHQPDLIIANGENAAGGKGLTFETACELLDAGVNVITSGNHIYDQREIIPYLERNDLPILRPANYPSAAPGRGYVIANNVLVINLIGRAFMQPVDCPFQGVDRILSELPERPPVVVVDFHAEATSEKQAMGWYLDGRVSAVVGTHTHVATADARLLPGRTAYCTDAGMTGPMNAVLGVEIRAALDRFLTGINGRLPVADGPCMLNAVLIDVDETTGRALAIMRADEFTE